MGVCIAIPAYNAAATVRSVVEEVMREGFPLLVVDDGSTDDTCASLHGLPVNVIRHESNQGKGAALRTAFSWVLEHGFEGVVTIDADGQHDPGAIGRLVARAREINAGIVIASRFAQFDQMAGIRSVWNRFGAWCIKKRTGFDISDSQSGFRYYSAGLLRSVTLDSVGYELEMELLLKSWLAGFTIDSLPVPARIADGRATSHYRPIRDTWNICMKFLALMRR